MTVPRPLLELTDGGLYCAQGGFFIDPSRRVERALITHAHADHARAGALRYLCVHECKPLLQRRLGAVTVESLRYGETRAIEGVKVSMHPAGHVLGSAQIRLERAGEVVVVSGDYKLHKDPTCAEFEAVQCHLFITESTFGLPVYRWPDPAQVIEQIVQWWAENAEAGRISVLLAYSLGKAQRLMAMLADRIPNLRAHSSVLAIAQAYREAGVKLPEVGAVTLEAMKGPDRTALVIVPPGAARIPWLTDSESSSVATVSGWMLIRGIRKRLGMDRGFVLSDHADWDGLLSAVGATGASEVWVTHGYREPLARWLRERGLAAISLGTASDREGGDAREVRTGGEE